MPLARAALYAQGIDIYLAPTWDNSDAWVPTLRHIAKEGRTYVIGVTSCIRATDLPAGLPGRADLYGGAEDWLSRGNTAIIGPGGDVLAGPLIGEEGIVYAEIDAARPGPAASSSTRSATTAAATSCAWPWTPRPVPPFRSTRHAADPACRPGTRRANPRPARPPADPVPPPGEMGPPRRESLPQASRAGG